MNEPIFGAPKRRPIRDPFGRPLDEYCLADDRAISCSGDNGSLKPFIDHVADVFGYEVDKCTPQSDIGLTINGKHVRLDILVADKIGNLLDVETQKSDEPKLVDRLTIYTAHLIEQQLNRGKDFGELKETVIVFVCKDDPLGMGRAVDIMEMAHLHNGEPMGAKVRWIVLSYKYLKNDPKDEMEWLLHDFFETDIGKIHSPEMAERLKYLRTEEGVKMMFETREEEAARKFAEGEAKGIVKGRAEGIAKEKEANVIGMLSEGIPLETIARVAKISIDDVKAIADRHGVKLP